MTWNEAFVVRWREVLKALTPTNRVHVSEDTSTAYRRLADCYTGTEVFGYATGDSLNGWKVPSAWAVNKATLKDPVGKVIADWHSEPLSLYTYSPPFSGTVPLDELKDHLFSNPSKPDVVPFHFRNQYRHWAADWGFCLPDKVLQGLPTGNYEVEIDTSFSDGEMEMALQTHDGDLSDCLLFVGHFDHPYQAGDGLVGCIAGHEVISRLKGRKTNISYKMLSTIEIIGSAFYAEKRARSDNVKQALFLATSGIKAPLKYATSVFGETVVDRVMAHILRHSNPEAEVVAFRSSIGNDEISFDVAGVDIPCGSLMRMPFEQYHSNKDVYEIIDTFCFEEVVENTLGLIDVLEMNATFKANFKGLPCLSAPEIDLYLSPPNMSGTKLSPNKTTEKLMNSLGSERARQQALQSAGNFNQLMTFLPALADGKKTVLDLAEKANVPFLLASNYTDMWVERGLLTKQWVNPFHDLTN